MINVYSDEYQLALKYPKDIDVNICNILIMARDFNIRDRNWGILHSHHSAYGNILMEVTDSLKLKLSSLVHQVLTQYTDNTNDSNLVIDLMFLQPDSQYSLDYALLIVDIFISEEFIQDK